MLAKPIDFCTTTRQECEAIINGVDTDFVLLLDPSDRQISKQIDNIVNHDCVEERLTSGEKFCLKVSFSDLLERLTLGKFKKTRSLVER